MAGALGCLFVSVPRWALGALVLSGAVAAPISLGALCRAPQGFQYRPGYVGSLFYLRKNFFEGGLS